MAQKFLCLNFLGLSGGERSYATACFVMSLWECMESPFRCLDEFDVYMDMLNRRVVMEMLVDMAVNNTHHQFFFFTPQGIQGLTARDNCQVWRIFFKAFKIQFLRCSKCRQSTVQVRKKMMKKKMKTSNWNKCIVFYVIVLVHMSIYALIFAFS